MQRGRPRHDDILTPREWEVLALVRGGLTNEQIAERLDVSLATAKFHVSEIMGKLGLESRQAAAQWPGKPQRLRAFFMLPLLQRNQTVLQVQSVGRAATLAVLVVALLGLVLLAAGIAVNSRGTVEEARLPPTAEVVEAVHETRVIVFSPLTTPSDRLQRDSCATSIVLAREGVWRCGTAPLDPCFGQIGDRELICPGHPDAGSGVVVELNQPLVAVTPPAGAIEREARQAWFVETANGAKCGFKAGGTSAVINGERVNFFCDDGSGLVGLPTPGEVWTAQQVERPEDYFNAPAPTGITLRTVELPTVWR